MSSKKYGLILPDRGPQKSLTFQASRNVFGDDSDSDDDKKKKSFLVKPSGNISRQAKISQEKAVLEDPTVYQYDEVYEDFTNKKESIKAVSKEEKKPKYIEHLLKSANKRKIENERRIERQIQKEREKEGNEFEDKEVFVTSAYKQKLEEMRLEEEKEKREEYLESIGDVTKQRDLGGFYRHLYEQKLGSEKKEEIKKENKESLAESEKLKIISNETTKEATIELTPKKVSGSDSSKRNYRKRKSSEDKNKLSEGEIQDSDDEINRVNLKDIKLAKQHKIDENIDADSDFSIDESSDEEIPDKNNEKNHTEDVFKKPVAPEESKTSNNLHEGENNRSKTPDVQPPPENKMKIDIWKKRTVGHVFDEALKRYYERKAARGY